MLVGNKIIMRQYLYYNIYVTEKLTMSELSSEEVWEGRGLLPL
jgi:hypothetical protein